MRETGRVVSVFAIIVALTGVTYLQTQLAQAGPEEAQMYAITYWPDYGDWCGSGGSGDSMPYLDDMCDAWYDELGADSDWYKDKSEINGDMGDSWFCDDGEVIWGNDDAYIDEGDAVMICTHGNSGSSGNYGAKVRLDEDGFADCYSRYSDWSLGETDIEFLHLTSCNSMAKQMLTNWDDVFDGLHQLEGFHGSAWHADGEESEIIDDYEDFATHALVGSIAEAWVDDLYIDDIGDCTSNSPWPSQPGGCEQCPVAKTAGVSLPAAAAREAAENYNSGLSDPTPNYFAYEFVADCDPYDNEEF